MIKITQPKFKKTYKRFKDLLNFDATIILHQYGRRGVQELAKSTPKDSGETASKWSYKVERTGDRYKLIWTNSELAGQAPLVLLIQYGHATKAGTFVSGIDFINPALKPIYKELAERFGQEIFA